MKGAYYNEIDPFAAAWLRNLISAGHIAPGDVDERSIKNVKAGDIAGYRQCHFFAGIGGWSYALRLAGWADDRHVWTGSCPCQPFSAAGKGGGFDDERHLWPEFYRLIVECEPTVVFGEQVASKAIDDWVDLVQADLETVGYAFGSVPFPSAGVGAPHLRDRNYWTGYAERSGLERQRGGHSAEIGQRSPALRPTAETGESSRMADADENGLDQKGESFAATGGGRFSGNGANNEPGPTNGRWGDADWLACRDGKWRPVESGSFPLANGVPGRVGRLRGYGNAINPVQAAEFIGAFMECQS